MSTPTTANTAIVYGVMNLTFTFPPRPAARSFVVVDGDLLAPWNNDASQFFQKMRKRVLSLGPRAIPRRRYSHCAEDESSLAAPSMVAARSVNEIYNFNDGSFAPNVDEASSSHEQSAKAVSDSTEFPHAEEPVKLRRLIAEFSAAANSKCFANAAAAASFHNGRIPFASFFFSDSSYDEEASAEEVEDDDHSVYDSDESDEDDSELDSTLSSSTEIDELDEGDSFDHWDRFSSSEDEEDDMDLNIEAYFNRPRSLIYPATADKSTPSSPVKNAQHWSWNTPLKSELQYMQSARDSWYL